MAKKRKARRVSLSLDEQVLKRIDRVAEAQQRSRSQTVEGLVLDGLQGVEGFVQMMGNPVLREHFAQALAQPGVLSELAATMGRQLDPGEMELFAETFEKLSGKDTGEAARKATSKKKGSTRAKGKKGGKS